MLNNRSFWIAQLFGLSLLYIVALGLAWQGQTSHWIVLLAVIILIAHVLEIPLAFRVLKPRNPEPVRVLVLTLIFGLLWWVPAKRGLFTVR
ncbi:MAG: hypothetical protein ACRETN_08040 [Nevskiales bacterium]